MICERCKKKQATVKLVKIINGVKKEQMLCSKCSISTSELEYDSDENTIKDFDFNKLLSDLINYVNCDSQDEVANKDSRCDLCGATYDEVKSGELIGCSNCYDLFEKEIRGMIKNFQGSRTNKKKYTFISEDIKTLEDLEYELKEAVKFEEYEKAAILRDYIKQRKSGGSSDYDSRE